MNEIHSRYASELFHIPAPLGKTCLGEGISRSASNCIKKQMKQLKAPGAINTLQRYQHELSGRLNSMSYPTQLCYLASFDINATIVKKLNHLFDNLQTEGHLKTTLEFRSHNTQDADEIFTESDRTGQTLASTSGMSRYATQVKHDLERKSHDRFVARAREEFFGEGEFPGVSRFKSRRYVKRTVTADALVTELANRAGEALRPILEPIIAAGGDQRPKEQLDHYLAKFDADEGEDKASMQRRFGPLNPLSMLVRQDSRYVVATDTATLVPQIAATLLKAGVLAAFDPQVLHIFPNGSRIEQTGATAYICDKDRQSHRPLTLGDLPAGQLRPGIIAAVRNNSRGATAEVQEALNQQLEERIHDAYSSLSVSARIHAMLQALDQSDPWLCDALAKTCSTYDIAMLRKERDAHNRSILQRAGDTGMLPLVIHLLPDASGCTKDELAVGLHTAAGAGEVDAIRFFLDKGALINAQDEHRLTALMLAAHQGHPGAVAFLIELGARTDLKEMHGLTAFQLATVQADVDTVAPFLPGLLERTQRIAADGGYVVVRPTEQQLIDEWALYPERPEA